MFTKIFFFSIIYFIMNKRPFYLTKRKLPSGKSIYYFYFYDKLGKRTVPQSTGCAKKSDAMIYCMNLFKNNDMDTSRIKFENFVKNWFDETSPWMLEKEENFKISTNTIRTYKNKLNNQLLPYFGKVYLDDISTAMVKDFRTHLLEKGSSPASINGTIVFLKTILNYAIEGNYISKNPILPTMKRLQIKTKREAFSMDEMVSILNPSLWSFYPAWLFTLTAALTGLRFGEVNGLPLENIKEGYLDINIQYTVSELKKLKTKNERFVTIPNRLATLLKELCDERTYVFWSRVNPLSPMSKPTIITEFSNVLSKINLEKKKERMLSFHSIRHFFNTYLVSKDINTSKVNFVIGHSEGKGTMLARYTTWRPEMYNDILQCQEELYDKLTLDMQGILRLKESFFSEVHHKGSY